jgi:hypothetical protein
MPHSSQFDFQPCRMSVLEKLFPWLKEGLRRPYLKFRAGQNPNNLQATRLLKRPVGG